MPKLGYVIIINGFAESGKDEFVNYLTDGHRLELSADPMLNLMPITSISSIDPVRNMLRREGFNVDNKTDEMRKLLADIGNVLIEWRIAKCIEFAMEQCRQHSSIVFVHMREPNNIAVLKEKLEYLNFRVSTLLIDRPGIRRVTNNAADRDVLEYNYDQRIDNDGSIIDLWMQAERYIKGRMSTFIEENGKQRLHDA